VAVIISLLNAGYAQTPEPLNGIDAYIEKALKDWNIPGLAIAIVKDDSVVLAKGYGVREIHKKEAVDANTIFVIASNTKAFTATALGLLVQEGNISWDDPVLQYLPEFQLFDPLATRKISIRDLLCHRAGLSTWGGDLTWYQSSYDRAEVLRRIRFQEPVFDFRTGYRYTNLMFLTAGEIIPEVTGQSWDEFLSERFFKPLGMRRTNTSVKDLPKMDNVAIPHMLYRNELITLPFLDVDNVGPAASMNSSVNDLAQWLRLQLTMGFFEGEQLVDTAVIQETRKPHNLQKISSAARKRNPFIHFAVYGLGWGLIDYRGRLIVRHTGGLDGMFSYVGFMPEEKLAVVVLTNREDHTLMRALSFHVYDLYSGVEFQDWSRRYLEVHNRAAEKERQKKAKRIAERAADTRPSHSLESYAGFYSDAVYGDAEIQWEEGKLKLLLSAHPQILGELEHWQYDTFLCRWNSPTWDENFIFFDLNDEGDIDSFRMKVRPDWIDTHEYEFRKKE
jgi:CubicO group peptidase (beta-lactamase class C family)